MIKLKYCLSRRLKFPVLQKKKFKFLNHFYLSVIIWSIRGIMLTFDVRVNGRRTCPSDTLSTTNTKTKVEVLNPVLLGKNAATQCMGRCTVIFTTFHGQILLFLIVKLRHQHIVTDDVCLIIRGCSSRILSGR